MPHAIAHGLRRRNIDVTTTSDADLLHATDEEHLAFALRETRVVFTNDTDFLRLAASGVPPCRRCLLPAQRIGEEQGQSKAISLRTWGTVGVFPGVKGKAYGLARRPLILDTIVRVLFHRRSTGNLR